jgi:hypothetical protein
MFFYLTIFFSLLFVYYTTKFVFISFLGIRLPEFGVSAWVSRVIFGNTERTRDQGIAFEPGGFIVGVAAIALFYLVSTYNFTAEDVLIAGAIMGAVVGILFGIARN